MSNENYSKVQRRSGVVGAPCWAWFSIWLAHAAVHLLTGLSQRPLQYFDGERPQIRGGKKGHDMCCSQIL